MKNLLISDVDVDETEINSSKLYAKNMLQVVDKKRRDGKTSKQGERCDDVIVNELLDAQAATIGAWKLDNVIDQVSLGSNDQPKSNRSLSSKISNAIKGILDMKHVNQTAYAKEIWPTKLVTLTYSVNEISNELQSFNFYPLHA